jgi:hypothetical protein
MQRRDLSRLCCFFLLSVFPLLSLLPGDSENIVLFRTENRIFALQYTIKDVRKD